MRKAFRIQIYGEIRFHRYCSLRINLRHMKYIIALRPGHTKWLLVTGPPNRLECCAIPIVLVPLSNHFAGGLAVHFQEFNRL